VTQYTGVFKNEYTINDWYSFFEKSSSKSFYNLEQKQIITRATDANSWAARIIFRGDTKIKIYETEILGFLEVLGTIGGIYELLYLI